MSGGSPAQAGAQLPVASPGPRLSPENAAPLITLVVARADNGAIGREGGLPWHIPADLKHFKAVTMGTAMVMGRRTFESLPGLLPGRRHIVLTRDRGWTAEGAETVGGIEEALSAAGGAPVSVIGGASVFAAFLPLASRIEFTEVHAAPEGDVSIPPFDPAHWDETAHTRHPAQGGRPAFSFRTLARKAMNPHPESPRP